jgi:bifunctional non-homologous end joining protein LigD
MLPRIDPVRPALSREIPLGRLWLYELKLDGFRGTLYVEKNRGRFFSKAKKIMPRFGWLADALARELRVRDCILDGEIVVMGESGPDFNALMFHRGQPQLVAFDLLWLNGRDLRPLPLWRRKRALQKLIGGSSIGYVEHSRDPRLFDSVVQMDLEGIVAKRRSDSYASGTEWLKIKHREYSQMAGRWELFDWKRRR